MTKISEALTYGLTIRESANDGSDFTNPVADYRRLFLGEDGALHLRDSAGAVTAVGGTSSGGALVLLEQHTASTSASLDFTSFISSTYDEYVFDFINVLPDGTAYIYFRCNTGSGFDTGSNYSWASYRNSASGAAVAGSTGVGYMDLTGNGSMIATAADAGLCGTMRLYSPGSTAVWKRVSWQTSFPSISSDININCTAAGAYMVSGSALTQVQFLAHTGNLTSGTIRVYGVAKS